MIYSFHDHSSPLNALSKIDGINVDKPNPLLPPPAGGGVPPAFGGTVGVENSRSDIIPLWDASRAVCMSSSARCEAIPCFKRGLLRRETTVSQRH